MVADEGHGDAVTELRAVVVETQLDRHQAHDLRRDAERQGVDLHGANTSSALSVYQLPMASNLDFHAGVDGVRLVAVDQVIL